MKVLIASDGSENATNAIRAVNMLPFETEPTLILLHVLVDVESIAIGSGEDIAAIDEVTKALRDEANRQLLEEAGKITVKGEVRSEVAIGHVSSEILRLAESEDVDLIVVGSRGLGKIQSFLLGSVSEQVVKYAKRPVLVAKQVSERVTKLKILIGTDGSRTVGEAPHFLTHFRREGLEVCVAAVMGLIKTFRRDILQKLSKAWDSQKKLARAEVDKLAEQIEGLATNVETLVTEAEEGDIGNKLVELAKSKDADLIAIGATGVSGLDKLMFGSVCNRVLQEADCSVLVLREKGK